MATAENFVRGNGSEARRDMRAKVIWRGSLFALVMVLGTMGSMGFDFRFTTTGEIPIIKAPKGPHWVESDDDGEVSTLVKLTVNELLVNREIPTISSNIVLATDYQPLSDEDLPVYDLLLAAGVKELNSMRDSVAASMFPILPRIFLSGGIRPVSADAAQKDSQVEEKVARIMPSSRAPLMRPRKLTEKYTRLGAGRVNTDKIKVDEKSVRAGSPVVQLGSFQNNEIAESSMVALQIKYDALIGDKKWLIQKTNFGTYSTYRLRIAGFLFFDDAVEFCNALHVRSQDCIPVTQN